MATDIQVPKLSMAMTEGVLSEWLIEDGAYVERDTPLYVIEAEKASQEIDAPVSGTLRIVGAPGETYQVGDLIARIE